VADSDALDNQDTFGQVAGMNGRALSMVLVGLLVWAGCSSKGPVKAKKDALTKRIEMIEATGESAKTTKDGFGNPKLSPAPSLGGAPYNSSNTLVMADVEIDWLKEKDRCSTSYRVQHPTPGPIEYCNPVFSSGNECAAEVASILRFDKFRESEWATESMEKCVSWLLAARYILVVHTESVFPKPGSSADFGYAGWGVLFDLGTGRVLGRTKLEGEDSHVLGGGGTDEHGRDYRVIEKHALTPGALAQGAIADAMEKEFAADVSAYRPHYKDR